MGTDSPTPNPASDAAPSPLSRAADKAGIMAAEVEDTAKLSTAALSALALSDVGDLMRRYGL